MKFGMMFNTVRYGGLTTLFDKNPLFTAVKTGNVKLVDHLVTKGNVNNQDKDGNTALHYAIEHKDNLKSTKIVEMLLGMNADPNIADNDTNTPLDIASINGNYSNIRLLEKYGAKVTKPNLFKAQLGKNIQKDINDFRELLKNKSMALSSDAHLKKISDIVDSLYEAISHDTTDYSFNNKYTTIYQNVLERGIDAAVPLSGADEGLSFDS
ncbi:ankyrin repeat domain-containing protein [Candidatus Tisiphia endosymbiont of Ditula angustiorana]|uniref:ankyrin repeat domain-containing protein n=1 Tax=Candidatus Tisiphia endosymbiont of Ditula angustiorana TaxID=3066272 RepID=UPI00312C6E9D